MIWGINFFDPPDQYNSQGESQQAQDCVGFQEKEHSLPTWKPAGEVGIFLGWWWRGGDLLVSKSVKQNILKNLPYFFTCIKEYFQRTSVLFPPDQR